MQTTINETGPSEYELEITATAEDLAPKIKEALRAQRMRTSMKGFRPGKVPMSLVKKMYGRALALEIAEKSIQETYEKEVVGSDEYDVMGYPKLTTLDYEDVDGDLRAVVKFGVRPPIELQDVEGEQVTRLVHQVTEEDVENEIDRLRKREADMIPKEEEAADEDDYAVIDLQPLDDSTGTPLLGQREEDVSFFMNDPRLKEELREALLGKKMGDTFRVDLPHEGDHDHEHEDEPESELLHVPPKEKEQRAHTHPYQVSLKELMRRELPELTPDWIEEVTEGEAENEEELREIVEKKLKAAWENQAREFLHERIVEKMLDLHDVHVPESIVDVYVDSFIEDVKKRNEDKLPPNFDEQQFRAANRPEAARQAKWALIRDRVIEEAGLEVEDEDRQRHFERAAEESEVTAEALSNFYKSMPHMAEQLDQRLLTEKVFAHLADKFDVQEKDRDAVEAEMRERAESTPA